MLIFDFNKAMAQVKELRQIASSMKNMNNQTLANAISGVQGAWDGQTSQQFLKKCNELKELIAKEAKNIDQVADSLEHSARIIEAAERAAAEAARRAAAAVAGGVKP